MKSHHSAILKLGFPIAIGQLGTIVLTFADTMMVGRYGTPELAAASFVNSVFNLATMIILGYSYGLTPLIAAHYGRGQKAEAGWVLRSGLKANLWFGTLLLLGFGVLYFFLGHLGQPEDLLPLMGPYYLVVWASMWFVLLFSVLRQFTDALTHTQVAMWILLGGNLLNILLNYLLIFGYGGLPELGLLGAGLATLTSRVLMVLVLFGIIALSTTYAPYRQPAPTSVPVSASDVHRQSWPVSAQMGFETLAFTGSSLMAGWLGTISLAAYQILIAIGQLGFLLYYSIGAAMSIRIAHFLGQHDGVSAIAAGRAGRNVLLGNATLTSALFLLGGHFLVSLFTTDTAVAAATLAIIPPLVAYQFADAMQVCYANALRATGRVRPMTWIALVAYLGIGLPLAYLLAFPLAFGLWGIFSSFTFCLLTAALLFHHYYRRAMHSSSS